MKMLCGYLKDCPPENTVIERNHIKYKILHLYTEYLKEIIQQCTASSILKYT